MKAEFKKSPVLLLIITGFLMSSPSQEPDTLDIPGNNVGVINRTIMGDTTASGNRKNVNRIYRLERGKIYYLTGLIEVRSYNLQIVADEDDPAHPVRPPLIAPAILEDDGSPRYFIGLYKGSCTLKNLYVNAFRPDQRPVNWGAALFNAGSSNRVVIKNCIFDGWTQAATYNFGDSIKMYISDCKFRNLQHPVSWFGGSVALSSVVPIDTIVLVNNSMFSSGSYFFCPNRDLCNYARVEYNTLFLNHVNPFYSPYLSNAVIRNNLFYGMISMGIAESERVKGYFDWKGAIPSIASIDTMPTYLAMRAGITEADRHIDFSNNVYFWPQKIRDYWTITLKDTVYQPSWMNIRTQNMFDDNENYPFLIAENNREADPEFPASVTSQVDSLIKYCYKIRSKTQTDYRWWYDPDNDLFGPQWPLPENLAYTNEVLLTASGQGLPVGDLNWFPEAKAQWEELQTGLKRENSPGSTGHFVLYQNYPNPFNPKTTIRYTIPATQNLASPRIDLSVYNLLGQKVARLVSEKQQPGLYEVQWDARSFASGIYFYILTTDQGFVQTRKLILLR